MRAKRVWLGTVATAAVVAAVVLLRRPGGRELAPSCPECRIHIEPHLQLDAGLRGVLAPPSAFAKDSRGRYYVAPTVERGQIAVYGADGALRTIIGRYGPGPGELGEVQMLAIGANDSLWVVDDRQRVSVFSPDGTFARSFQHHGIIDDFTVLSKSGWFVVSIFPVYRSPNPPVLLHAANGAPYALMKASLDGEPPLYTVAASVDSTVVVVNNGSYTVSVFDAQRQETRFTPAPDWFREPLPGTRSPRGEVLDIDLKDSLLWVYYRERHPRPVARNPSDESVKRIGPLEILAGSTFYLDVVDVRKNRLVARTTMRDWFIAGLIGDEVVARREIDAGDEEVWVLRVTLKR